MIKQWTTLQTQIKDDQQIKIISLPSRNIMIIHVSGQVLISDASNKTLFQMI